MLNLEIENRVLKDIKLIIFDKDGTLFELYPFWNKVAFKRAEFICRSLKTEDAALMERIALKMGVDSKNKKMCRMGPIGIYSRSYIEELIYQDLKTKGFNLSKEVVQQAFRETDEYINRNEILRDSLVPVKGLIEFLNRIKGRCKCAVFSYDLTDRLKNIAGIFQVQDNFDMFLGGDLIKSPKPDPWGAVYIMNTLNISPEKTIFFGDSALDIECGKRAKCKFVIGVISDISNIEFLQAESNTVIKDFSQVNVF